MIRIVHAGVCSLLLACLSVSGTACGGSRARSATTPLPMPADVASRHAAMDAFGRRLHAALAAGRPIDVLLGDDELRVLLAGSAATRVAAHRAAIGMRVGDDTARLTLALEGTEYLGVCLQDARDEPDGATLGLRAPGWVFGRVLVAARRPGGHRIALWIDGVFVFTDAGFGALDLERIEAPRPRHSDLELAPCDMATNLG
ncbi:MAG: hypothetical protein M3Y87_35805 [Myxococcota bacterium]|nr:hypothetical protein [Myxococcota bacterium]